MSAEHKSSGHKKANLPRPNILMFVVAVFLLLLACVLVGLQDKPDRVHKGRDEASIGTICPPFSADGATCDVGTEGTAWIRPDSRIALPENALYCWDNLPEEFRLVEYLVGGKKHAFDPSGPPPGDVSAYRFFPKERTTLVYNLATACRPR
jgi:hypothetical protein